MLPKRVHVEKLDGGYLITLYLKGEGTAAQRYTRPDMPSTLSLIDALFSIEFHSETTFA